MPTEISVPGLVLTDHAVQVPLDHARPDGEQITVFAREVAERDGRDRPFLVFLQGGPGSEAPRPTRFPTSPGWLDRALVDHRVLMLDQRGTGRSTPVGRLPGMDAPAQAAYLQHFRADSIVRDAELIREALGVDRWSVLGQSFGGFCALTYLSVAPQSLRRALFTGGLPPIGADVDDVYRRTYATMRGRNEEYYARYLDRDRVRDLHARLEVDPVSLPGGDLLTSRRFRQIGMSLGMSDGAAQLRSIVELDPDSPLFAHLVDAALPFAAHPIYPAIHEACYADGVATAWSAARVLPEDFATDPTLFTGEHVFPWMFAEYGALHPLADAAELLAQVQWPRLYDPDVLRTNEVPAAAAIYARDAYVDRELSERTAGQVRGLRPWLTNEYEHNGLRADGACILDRLLKLSDGDA